MNLEYIVKTFEEGKQKFIFEEKSFHKKSFFDQELDEWFLK